MKTNKVKRIPKPTYFGLNLKYLRRLQGLSQTKLAEALNLKRSNISSYEAGVVEPDTDRFLKICQYFGAPPAKMLAVSLEKEHIEKLQNSDTGTTRDQLRASLSSFIALTQEVSKISLGYKALLEIRSSQSANDDIKSLEATLKDFVFMLDMVARENWSLIQALVPETQNDQEE